MKSKNREILRIAAAAIAGILVGAATIQFQVQDLKYTAQDLSDAYDSGYIAALKIDPPGEQLEIVCAALWFSEQIKDKE